MSQEQGLHLGPDDRPTGAEGVGGRAGGRGDEQGVAAEGGDGLPVHADSDLQHACAVTLLQRGLVEGPVVTISLNKYIFSRLNYPI